MFCRPGRAVPDRRRFARPVPASRSGRAGCRRSHAQRLRLMPASAEPSAATTCRRSGSGRQTTADPAARRANHGHFVDGTVGRPWTKVSSPSGAASRRTAPCIPRSPAGSCRSGQPETRWCRRAAADGSGTGSQSGDRQVAVNRDRSAAASCRTRSSGGRSVPESLPLHGRQPPWGTGPARPLSISRARSLAWLPADAWRNSTIAFHPRRIRDHDSISRRDRRLGIGDQRVDLGWKRREPPRML